MSNLPKPPKAYSDFIQRFPNLGKAWEIIAEEGQNGGLDERSQRLVKLGIAVGALKEGAVHASVRKALAQGITPEELEQIVSMAAGTLGMPSAVAVYSWIKDELNKQSK